MVVEKKRKRRYTRKKTQRAEGKYGSETRRRGPGDAREGVWFPQNSMGTGERRRGGGRALLIPRGRRATVFLFCESRRTSFARARARAHTHADKSIYVRIVCAFAMYTRDVSEFIRVCSLPCLLPCLPACLLPLACLSACPPNLPSSAQSRFDIIVTLASRNL